MPRFCPRPALKKIRTVHHIAQSPPAALLHPTSHTCACRSLKNLDLGGNDAGPDGAAALAEALVSHPSLTLLELGYNPLGPAGAATITGGLPASCLPLACLTWCAPQQQEQQLQAFLLTVLHLTA